MQNQNLGARTELYWRINQSRSFKTTLKLLREIALSGKACQYDLPKKVGGVYRNLLRHLETLKKLGFIELDHTEASSKKGKEKNFWHITFLGLLRTLMEKENLEFIDRFAENYAEQFPLVFGKWSFFKRRGIEKQVIDRIRESKPIMALYISKILTILDLEEIQANSEVYEKDAVQMYEEFMRVLSSDVIARLPSPQELIQDERNLHKFVLGFSGNSKSVHMSAQRVITASIFGLRGSLWEGKKLTGYLSILKEDEEIKRYISDELNRIRLELEEEFATRLRNLDSFESWWAQVTSKNRSKP